MLHFFFDPDEAFHHLIEVLALLMFVSAAIYYDKESSMRKKAESNASILERAEQRFRQSLDNIPEGCQIVDFDQRFLYANNSVLKRMGVTKEKLLGKTSKEANIATQRPSIHSAIENCLKDRVSSNHVEDLILPGGVHRWIEFDFQPVPEGVFILSIDRTEEKNAAEQIKQSNERFRQSLDNIPMGCQIIDFDHCLKYVNDANARHRGTTKEALIGKNMLDASIGTPRLKIRSAIEKCLKERVAIEVEDEILLPSGEKIWMEWSVQPVPEGVFVLSIDATVQKKAEEQVLLQSTALESAANGIIITDTDGKIQWVNPSFSNMTGYSSEEAIGQNPRLYQSGKQDQSFYEDLWGTIKSGKVWYGELINRRKDGTLYDEEETITPILDKEGVITNFVAIKQDISDRREAQETQRKSDVYINRMGDALVVINMERRLIKVNQAFLDLSGYSIGDIDNLTLDKLIPEDEAKKNEEALGEMMQAGKMYIESSMLKKDGTEVPVMISAIILTNNEGTPNEIVAVLKDITERIEHEEEKLKALGVAAKSIAHDVRNPLSVIRTASFLMKDAKAKERKDVLGVIDRNVVRADNIVRSLMDFASTPTLKLLEMDVNNFIEEILASTALPKNIKLTTHYGKIPTASLDNGVMTRVLMNLITNSTHAMPQGGELTVTTDDIDGFIEIRIADTGTGISKENLGKLFSPFFTTKTQGTGLGLVNVKNAIEGHGGKIQVESEEGKGTTMIIRLPPKS